MQQGAIELPQGGWEMAVENPEGLARGVLREETGLHAEEMTLVGHHWIGYGFTRQKQHVFLATGLSQAEREPDIEEHDIVVRHMPITYFEQLMLDGEMCDGCMLAACALYLFCKARP